MTAMQIAFLGLTIVTAILHGLFFKLESLDFMKPAVLRRLGLNSEQGKVVKTWAFNQGFYNLFLALSLIFSLYLYWQVNSQSGLLLARSNLLFIVGAGLVLGLSAPSKYPAALLQALPALLALLASCFL